MVEACSSTIGIPTIQFVVSQVHTKILVKPNVELGMCLTSIENLDIGLESKGILG